MIAAMLDATTRALEVIVVSLTRVGEGFPKLVVRFGASIGYLANFKMNFALNQTMAKYPLLVVGRGYEAQSSAGFVRLTGREDGHVVAACGCLRARGLRVINPLSVSWFARPSILDIPTGRNSNPATAAAALAAMDSRRELNMLSGEHLLCLQEGQSDAVSGWEIRELAKEEFPEIPPEHRDISERAILVEALGYGARRRREGEERSWEQVRADVDALAQSNASQWLERVSGEDWECYWHACDAGVETFHEASRVFLEGGEKEKESRLRLRDLLREIVTPAMEPCCYCKAPVLKEEEG